MSYLNQWKLLSQLKDSISKLSNDKSFQNVLGKDLTQFIQKCQQFIPAKQIREPKTEVELQTQARPKIQVDNNSKDVVSQQTWKKNENLVSLSSISSQTDHVMLSIESAENEMSLLNRLEALVSHIRQYPDGRNNAIKDGAIRLLLNIRNKTTNDNIQGAVREALALLGYADPVPGRGIRILAMDGGGIRGLLILEMLKKLEELTGKRTHELFDLLCGVSTGAILSLSIGIHQKSLDEIARGYKAISTEVFKQSALWGTGNLMWTQSYYDTSLWEKKLRDHLGSDRLITTARDAKCPKLCLVSAIVNQSRVSAYVFKNYSLPWRIKSQYSGGYEHEAWQAARASAAAPTYFEEFKLGNTLHQDGGILVNNPTAVAIHEAKLIWPNTPIQCVVSCGTGRSVPSPAELQELQVSEKLSSTSWTNKFSKILDSATDTEGVHIMLSDLLPDDVYYRFNPYLTEVLSMTEIRPEKLKQLERDAIMYLRRNEDKFQAAAKALTGEKTAMQKMQDFISLKRDMYGF